MKRDRTIPTKRDSLSLNPGAVVAALAGYALVGAWGADL